MRTLNWSFAVLLVAASNLHAQQGVDDLVAKYAQRVGGADRLHSVQSVRRIGKFYGGGGFEARLTNENKRPNKVREEFEFGGMTGVNAYDGHTGWKIEPWQGKKDAESLSEDETKDIISESAFDDPLLNYRAAGTPSRCWGATRSRAPMSTR
jgi:hypothetical protein